MFFAMVILFATATGEHHTGVAFFPSAKACEAAKGATLKTLTEQMGAVEVGMACAPAISVAKVG